MMSVVNTTIAIIRFINTFRVVLFDTKESNAEHIQRIERIVGGIIMIFDNRIGTSLSTISKPTTHNTVNGIQQNK